MKKISTVFVLLLICVSVLVGCFSEKKTAKINWQKQGMESALQMAKEQSKPLLVYWGAAWCPPCNVLKSTIFTEDAFIKATQSFVSVYLDGDTDNAQVWGEKLKAAGYPTLMVLNAKGHEIVRLSTAATAEEMAEVLGTAAHETAGIYDWLIAWDGKTATELTEDKLELLANYSWSQNREGFKDDLGASQKFEAAAALAPEKMAAVKMKLRFLGLKYFLKAVTPFKTAESDKTKTQKTKPNPEDLKRWKEFTELVFSDTSIATKYLGQYVYDFKGIRDILYGKEAEAFETLVRQLMVSLQKQPLNFDQKLSTLYPFTAFVKDGEKMNPKDASVIKKVTAEVGQSKLSDKAYHAAIGDIGYYLFKAGENDLAKKTLLEGLKKSHSPYYLMSTLGYIHKELGEKVQSLKWYKKAYNTSQGGATQLQWGKSYLSALIKLAPEGEENILSHAQEIFVKHTQRSDSFMGRSERSLKSVKTSLLDWSKEHKAELKVKKLFKNMSSLCRTRHLKADSYQKPCGLYFQI